MPYFKDISAGSLYFFRRIEQDNHISIYYVHWSSHKNSLVKNSVGIIPSNRLGHKQVWSQPKQNYF